MRFTFVFIYTDKTNQQKLSCFLKNAEAIFYKEILMLQTYAFIKPKYVF
jgi:hypothetical protein